LIFFSTKDEVIDFAKNLKEKLWKKEQTSYREYLSKNFTLTEEKVSLKNLLKTYEINQTKRSLRIHFWATKRKVCHPYES
jgi:hypothetical protein